MIERVAYQPNARVLDLIFRDGKIYRHFLLQWAIVDGLKVAYSPCAFYHSRFRGRIEVDRLR